MCNLLASILLDMMDEMAEDVHPSTLDEMLLSVPPHKKKVYRVAVATFPEVLPQHYLTTVWGKTEKNDSAKGYPSANGGMAVDQRAVLSMHPRYNVQLMTTLHWLEKAIFKYKSDGTFLPYGHVFSKGMNYAQTASKLLAKWKMFTETIAVMIDVSRMDRSVHCALLSLEHSAYLYAFRHATKDVVDELQFLLQKQSVLKGIIRSRKRDFDGKCSLKFSNRQTGCVNTAMGNSILVVATILAHMKIHGIKPHEWALLDAGDDCVLFCEKAQFSRILETLPATFFDAGFHLRVDNIATRFTDIVFCQTRPFKVNNRWTMIRDYRRVLNRAGVVPRAYMNDQMPSYMYTYALTEALVNTGVPVLGPFFYNLAEKLAKDKVAFQTRYLDPFKVSHFGVDFTNPTYNPPTSRARMLFDQMYGITPIQQIRIENYTNSFPHTSLYNFRTNIGVVHLASDQYGLIVL